MPRFDGTGPRGAGPMSGRGEGYCVVELPGAGRPVQGYAGLQATPVGLEALADWRQLRRPGSSRGASGPTRVFRRGLGLRGRGRGRGRVRGRSWW